MSNGYFKGTEMTKKAKTTTTNIMYALAVLIVGRMSYPSGYRFSIVTLIGKIKLEVRY